ncbi:Uncharacterized conserved protein YkwD, contains CAP (CSP/antigen 5/PR1) domain [Cupriavidus sp. YR651]|uniref:CAP domain-containing protein n=1 Tax=Cupriavidus sp. YR651 TaxID=1855315 RepID=UPI00088FB572|nr:CAP domain-containing protein [Cupriavidus sp. YR651]SDC19917.1 Uncharacterized conserved protein YkwD, contains CAP (CSP/antigen 5/PR1) domain [Cupriavidus sp. YR651]
MHYSVKAVLSVVAFASLLPLTACGGGGDGGTAPQSNSGGTATPPAVVAPTSVTPVTSVPAPTYATPALSSAFSALNSVRGKMGVGLLRQDTILDTAADNHITYAKANNITMHTETQALTGFTGATPYDQVVAAGGSKAQWIGQVMGHAGFTDGAECVGNFLGSVYHLQAVTSNQETIGVAFRDSYCVINFGITTGANGSGYGLPQWGGQQMATNAVAYYPVDNATVVGSFNPASESPNPAPDVAMAGTPIMFRMSAPQGSDVVTVSSFTLVGPSGAAVPARVLVPIAAKSGSMTGAVADANLYAGVVFLLPTQPLVAGLHTVTFSGARNGVAVSRSWSFTAI